MIKPVLYILFGALFTGATSLAAGCLILRRLRLRLYRAEERLFGFVLGSALLSLTLFEFSALHIVYKGVLLGLGAVVLNAALALGAFRGTSESAPPLSPPWRWLFWSAFAVYAALYFFYALAPEISPDGSTYHLRLVEQILRARGFQRVPWDFYKNMPAGVELLFLFAFAFGRNSAAALVHFQFLLALPLLIVNFGRRFGVPAAGAVAAILVFASPVAGIDGVSAYVDCALAVIIFAMFYLLRIWNERRDNSLLLLAGVLGGFAFSAKYTGGIALLYALAFAGWKLWRAKQPWLKPLAIMSAAASLWILPWVLKSWIWTGDPLIPFFSRLFPNPIVHPSFVSQWSRQLRTYNLASYWELPWQVTVRADAFPSFIGPVFLLTPVVLLGLKRPLVRALALAALVFGASFFANLDARFLIPALPFLSLAIGIVVASWNPLAAALVLVLHALLSLPVATRQYANEYFWGLPPEVPWRGALRIVPEDEWLLRHSPGYAADRMIERLVPPNEPVFSTFAVTEAYTSRKIQVAYESAQGEVMQDFLFAAITPDFQPSLTANFGFPPRDIHKLRVVQTAMAASQQWSVAEFRIYHLGVEVPRSASWRIRASPNPWDVQLAFDNSLLTRWRSWDVARPGMFVEIDFPAPVWLESVALRVSPDESQTAMRLEGADGTGQWSILAPSAHIVPKPLTYTLRAEASVQLKRRGFHYLLVNSDNYGAEDIARNAGVWGLRLLDEQGGARLYAIQ